MANDKKIIVVLIILFSVAMFGGCMTGNPRGFTRFQNRDFFRAIFVCEAGKLGAVRAMLDQNSELVHATYEPSQNIRMNDALSYFLSNFGTKGITPLHMAAYAPLGCVNIAKTLVMQGADVNAKTNKGITPLQLAVISRNERIAKLLITNGAEVNAKDVYGRTALYWCSVATNRDEFTLFPPTTDRLQKIAELLCSHGAIGQCETAIVEEPEISRIKRSDSSKVSRSTLLLLMEMRAAVADGDLVKVKSLFEKNSELVNAPFLVGQTLLMEASLFGHKNIVEFLIAKGADVNARNDNGTTALHLAAPAGHEEIVRILLVHGAKTKAKNNKGETPLDRAARFGQRKIVDLLR